jgi:hypothetical protein
MISTQLKSTASLVMTAAMLALSASAFAADHQTKSRAEVKAEAEKAVAGGMQIGREGQSPMVAQAMSKLSKEEMTALRAMIFAETTAFIRGGMQIGREGQSPMVAQAMSKLTKEEAAALTSMIRMEAVKAAASGQLEKN